VAEKMLKPTIGTPFTWLQIEKAATGLGEPHANSLGFLAFFNRLLGWQCFDSVS
jgi:hypothetical protein